MGSLSYWVLVLGVACGLAAIAGENPFIIGPNVHVSLAQPKLQHMETQIGADPGRASHLIACGIVETPDNKTSNVFYASFDGGKTWTQTLAVENSVDPSCIIGIQGTAFAGSIHDVTLPDGTTPSFLDVRHSTDGGRTWQKSSVSIDTRSVDRAYLTIDDSRGQFRGRVYAHGYLQRPRDSSGKPLPAAFAFYPSTNGGRSFESAIVQTATNFSAPWYFLANGVVSSDGTFTALFVELDNTKRNMSYRTDPESAPRGVNGVLSVVRSRDGGKTLEPASKIAEVYYDWRMAQLSMPSLAVDRTGGPFEGRMYAVWPNASLERRTQIFLSISSDAGRTWSPSRVISDDASELPAGRLPNHLMPMVAVNKHGVVGVCWYDRRDHPDNLGYWIRFSASLDGGRTWLPSARVSTHANDVVEAEHYTHLNGGDTVGLTADAQGVFHPLWIDNRTGVHQMWTSTVTVKHRAR